MRYCQSKKAKDKLAVDKGKHNLLFVEEKEEEEAAKFKK